ncbi:Ankyrin repeat-containing protein, partial [Globisporangium splendens]
MAKNGDLEVGQSDGSSQHEHRHNGDAGGVDIAQLMSSESSASPKDVAHVLHHTPHMDPKVVGRVLGEPDDVSLSVLQEYANGFVFKDYSFDVALRVYLGRFVLPGEAQKIDRILQAFAKAYFAANPRDPVCTSEDAVYTLAFSVVLLNTDAHNPHLARRFKMGKDDFIRNHQRILVDGKPMPHRFLAQCYDSFATYPITLIGRKQEPMLVEDEIELTFGDGPLGLDIETSIDGRTCLVKKHAQRHLHASTNDGTGSRAVEPPVHITGWVVVAVGDDSTRELGYPMTRCLLKTAARPVVIRFCEPSVYFASLE